MQTVYVKPRAGGRVRMPDRKFRVMPAEGTIVQRIDYYERLIIAGDLIITDPPAPAAPPKSAEPSNPPEPPQGGSAV
jgi:hypothetical protein